MPTTSVGMAPNIKKEATLAFLLQFRGEFIESGDALGDFGQGIVQSIPGKGIPGGILIL